MWRSSAATCWRHATAFAAAIAVSDAPCWTGRKLHLMISGATGPATVRWPAALRRAWCRPGLEFVDLVGAGRRPRRPVWHESRDHPRLLAPYSLRSRKCSTQCAPGRRSSTTATVAILVSAAAVLVVSRGSAAYRSLRGIDRRRVVARRPVGAGAVDLRRGCQEHGGVWRAGCAGQESAGRPRVPAAEPGRWR